MKTLSNFQVASAKNKIALLIMVSLVLPIAQAQSVLLTLVSGGPQVVGNSTTNAGQFTVTTGNAPTATATGVKVNVSSTTFTHKSQ